MIVQNKFKCIIAGSRNFSDYKQFCFLLDELLKDKEIIITEVFSGMAKGPDLMGKCWAEENNIPVREFSANWMKYGNSAGFIRNSEMLNSGADCLIAFWDGESKGTKNMIDIAKKKGISVFVYHFYLSRP